MDFLPFLRCLGQIKNKSGGSGYRSRFSTLRRLYATMYNNPPVASFGTRTRTYTLEGCNSTLKLRMRENGGEYCTLIGPKKGAKNPTSVSFWTFSLSDSLVPPPPLPPPKNFSLVFFGGGGVPVSTSNLLRNARGTSKELMAPTWNSTTQAVEWPSGLRRSTQVRVSSEAWVRTPLQPSRFFFLHFSIFKVTYFFFVFFLLLLFFSAGPRGPPCVITASSPA